MNILIPNNIYNECIIKIIGLLFKNIKNNLDISSDFLNEIINNVDVIRYINFVYKQLYFELLENISEYNKNKSLININIDKDLCGFNDCNKHKYLHFNKELNNQIDEVITHEFVAKTEKQINDEIIMCQRYTLFKTFINNIYYYINKIITYYIYNGKKLNKIYIFDNEIIKDLYCNINKYIFKEKNIIVENNKKYINVYL